MNCDLTNNNNSAVTKLGMCVVSVLFLLQVKHYIVKACIIEHNLSIKLKNHHLQTCVYMNFFVCFDVQNSLLKFVHAFQIHPA